REGTTLAAHNPIRADSARWSRTRRAGSDLAPVLSSSKRSRSGRDRRKSAVQTRVETADEASTRGSGGSWERQGAGAVSDGKDRCSAGHPGHAHRRAIRGRGGNNAAPDHARAAVAGSWRYKRRPASDCPKWEAVQARSHPASGGEVPASIAAERKNCPRL